jgi:hypothetical protein
MNILKQYGCNTELIVHSDRACHDELWKPANDQINWNKELFFKKYKLL